MVSQKYRWDFIGLSTDTKPTSETSDKVVNGSTYYCSDTSKLYVYCNGTWYERKPLGGGGSGGSYTAGTGIDITDDTISLNSASQTSLAKADTAVQVTDYASSTVGGTIKTSNSYGTKMANTGVLYGNTFTYSGYQNTANDGAFISKATLENVIAGKGLNPTLYVISGAGAPTTSTVGTVGKIYEDTTNGKLYICTSVTPGTDPDPDTYTWTEVGSGGGGSSAITELTTADYDVTIHNTQGIALWRLTAGLYHTANDVQAFAGNDSDFKLSLKSHLIIIDDDGNQKMIKVVGDDFNSYSTGVYKGFIQYKVAASDGSGQFAQSESVISTANLMQKIGSTPTSSNIGFRGQLWYDSANNKLYVNVNKPGDYAGNWKEISLAS